MKIALCKTIRRGVLASLALVTLLSGGCSSNLFLEPNVPTPVVETAPVSVGIYYDDALRNHKCTGGKGYIAYEWTVEMGPPSVAMFDGAFATLFQEVENVDARPGVTAARSPWDVIEMRLTEYNGCDARWPVFGTTVIVAYEAILWSADGRELTRWHGRGQAGPYVPDGEPMESQGEAAYLAAVTSLAMRRAAADLVINFETNPVVQARFFRRPE